MVTTPEPDITTAFERFRTGNRRVNNCIYTFLTIRHALCKCCSTFRLRDFIESFTEEDKVLVDTNEFRGEPISLVGANIPSIMGGLTVNAWSKFSGSNLLRPEVVNTHDPEKHHGS